MLLLLVYTTVLGEQDFPLAFHSLKECVARVCLITWDMCVDMGVHDMARMHRAERYFVKLVLSIHLYVVSRNLT